MFFCLPNVKRFFWGQCQKMFFPSYLDICPLTLRLCVLTILHVLCLVWPICAFFNKAHCDSDVGGGLPVTHQVVHFSFSPPVGRSLQTLDEFLVSSLSVCLCDRYITSVVNVYRIRISISLHTSMLTFYFILRH